MVDVAAPKLASRGFDTTTGFYVSIGFEAV